MNPLTENWYIRDVEIPSRIVLAPMAGVSVHALRRQGRRSGPGWYSEMVSSCGLSYGNERTLGYLRIARDEHPLWLSRSLAPSPSGWPRRPRWWSAAGADIVDINFGCPVRKVKKRSK